MKILPILILFFLIISCADNDKYKNATFINYKYYSTTKEFLGHSYQRIKIDSININSFAVSVIFDSSLNNGYRYIPKPIDTIRNGSTIISIDTNFLETTYYLKWSKDPTALVYFKTVNALDSSNKFNYFKSKDYLIRNSNYTVYCIGHLSFETDGDYFVFLNNHFGLVATYTYSWKNLSYQDKINGLIDPDLNSLIDTLIKDSSFFPVPDSFRINQIRKNSKNFYDTYEEKELQKLFNKNGL